VRGGREGKVLLREEGRGRMNREKEGGVKWRKGEKS